MHFHGIPSLGDVALFLVGALTGFSVLGLAVHSRRARPDPVVPGRVRILAGVLDWLAVALAVGLGGLLAQVPSAAAWPLASATATVVYLVAASLQLTIVSALAGPPET